MPGAHGDTSTHRRKRPLAPTTSGNATLRHSSTGVKRRRPKPKVDSVHPVLVDPIDRQIEANSAGEAFTAKLKTVGMQHTVQQDGAGITIDYINKTPSDDASLKKKVLVAALDRKESSSPNPAASFIIKIVRCSSGRPNLDAKGRPSG